MAGSKNGVCGWSFKWPRLVECRNQGVQVCKLGVATDHYLDPPLPLGHTDIATTITSNYLARIAYTCLHDRKQGSTQNPAGGRHDGRKATSLPASLRNNPEPTPLNKPFAICCPRPATANYVRDARTLGRPRHRARANSRSQALRLNFSTVLQGSMALVFLESADHWSSVGYR